MGDLESARDYLTRAAKQAARFDGVDSSKICESKLFAEMGITNQPHYDNFGKTAMEAAERRVMTDAEIVPQLPAIWAEIRKDTCVISHRDSDNQGKDISHSTPSSFAKRG